jgi:trimethylamine:corrinoid methyltransferase-like protein
MTRPERRSGGHEARLARRAAHRGPLVPLINRLPFTEVLSPEGVEKIHAASMRLLRETGIQIADFPPACETFAAH